jgi:hypothetical protein
MWPPSRFERGKLMRRWLLLVVLTMVGLGLAAVYTARVTLRHADERRVLHDQIVQGSAPSPYCYRVLVPFLAEGGRRAASNLMPPAAAFAAPYVLLDLIGYLALLHLAFSYSRLLFAPTVSLVGALWIAATLPAAMLSHYYQPWSVPEAALFLLVFHQIARGRPRGRTLLCALAAANRETAVFLGLACLLDRVLDRERPARGRHLLYAVLPLASALGTHAAIRLARGHHPHAHPFEATLAVNLEARNIAEAAVNLSVFVVPWLVAAALAPRAWPPFARRVLPAFAAYFIAWIFFSYWREVRVFMSFYPLFLPCALAGLFPSRKGTGA